MYLLNQKMSLIYFDFETTGLNPYHDTIIDFCFLKEPLLQDKTECILADIPKDADFILNEQAFSSLLDTDNKISSKITEITNITKEMLLGKPYMEDMIHSICNWVSDDSPTSYLLAHNCHGFDQLFLERIMRECDLDPKSYNWKFIDTMLLAKKIKPEMFSYSLKTLCKYHKIEEGKHRALSDCIAMREVYKKLLQNLSDRHFKGEHSAEFLLKNPQIVYHYLYLS